MNDYFQRLGAVRLQFVSEQGQRDVRTNVAIFKDAFRDIFAGFATSISALSQSGAIGDQLPRTQAERNRMAEVLRQAELENKLSMITLVDLQGRTILSLLKSECVW